MTNKQLQVCDVEIRLDADGRYCLNDLHRAAGGAKKDNPTYWLTSNKAQDLVQELSDTGNPVTVIRGGLSQGTYVVRELVYAYAMWISAAFHVKVLRAYDTLQTQGVAVAEHAAEDLLKNPLSRPTGDSPAQPQQLPHGIPESGLWPSVGAA